MCDEQRCRKDPSRPDHGPTAPCPEGQPSTIGCLCTKQADCKRFNPPALKIQCRHGVCAPPEGSEQFPCERQIDCNAGLKCEYLNKDLGRNCNTGSFPGNSKPDDCEGKFCDNLLFQCCGGYRCHIPQSSTGHGYCELSF